MKCITCTAPAPEISSLSPGEPARGDRSSEFWAARPRWQEQQSADRYSTHWLSTAHFCTCLPGRQTEPSAMRQQKTATGLLRHAHTFALWSSTPMQTSSLARYCTTTLIPARPATLFYLLAFQFMLTALRTPRSSALPSERRSADAGWWGPQFEHGGHSDCPTSVRLPTTSGCPSCTQATDTTRLSARHLSQHHALGAGNQPLPSYNDDFTIEAARVPSPGAAAHSACSQTMDAFSSVGSATTDDCRSCGRCEGWVLRTPRGPESHHS